MLWLCVHVYEVKVAKQMCCHCYCCCFWCFSKWCDSNNISFMTYFMNVFWIQNWYEHPFLDCHYYVYYFYFISKKIKGLGMRVLSSMMVAFCVFFLNLSSYENWINQVNYFEEITVKKPNYKLTFIHSSIIKD